MYAIETDKLRKRFGELVAVNDVSFQVRTGEVFGLLGPNGAGKTTIIKMLSTLIAPTQGSAAVWGHSITAGRDAVRRSIGMVFQDPAVDDRLTGRENLDFHARMYGQERQLRRKRIQEVLELVGLSDKADVLLKHYSGGMKRRLEIARGLMHYPRVLFLDEPTLGLDPQTRHHIWAYIKELNVREQVTVILTTHYMEEADELCSRVGIIDHGEIRVIDTPAALKNTLGNDLITIRASDIDSLERGFTDAPWVQEVSRHDGTLLVSARQGDEKVPEVVDVARKLGVVIQSVAVHTPTLEDVFLHYTGKSIREEQVSKADRTRSHLRSHRRS